MPGDDPRPEKASEDDLRAREVLLTFLEGRMSLDQAAAEYVACFPSASGLSVEQVRRKWSAWSPAMRSRLAQQIRWAMDKPVDSFDDA